MKNRDITLKTQLKFWEVISITVVFFAAILIGTIINSEVFTIAEVSNVSMQDTLVAGEKIYINKSAYWNKAPERGDIIVFLKGESLGGFFNKLKITTEDIYLRFSPEIRDNRLIKRVIGIPGDILEIKGGEVFVDYTKLNESYTKGKTYPYRTEGRITVPEGSVFVMGDNREDSNDSRSFGFVELNSIEGKAVFRYWPFKRAIVFEHSYFD
ncbi:MAG: signal peptidase I [Clostridiales bacterium]|nr:signal peptidase I [Clostridiales bacterium]